MTRYSDLQHYSSTNTALEKRTKRSPKKKHFLIAGAIAVSTFITPAFAFNNANDQLDHGIDLYDNQRFENSSDALRALVYDRLFRRLDSLEKALALKHLTYGLMEQGEYREALLHTNSTLRVVKGDYGKQSIQYVDTLLTYAQVQYRMGNNREAIRSAEEMATILERLGSEYSSELDDARTIPSSIRRKSWDDKRLRKDLSDFYTQCETIESGEKLPAASRKMNEYLLVGRQYKPKLREKNKFRDTYIKKARENSSDRKNRLIFIPDEEHIDDWCVIYPDGVLVDRIALAPPED